MTISRWDDCAVFYTIETRLSARTEIVTKDVSVIYKTAHCPKTAATVADKSITSPRKLRILQRHSHVLVWLFIDHVYPAVQTGFRWCFHERSGDLDNSGNPICHSVYPRKIQNWSLRRNRRRKTLTIPACAALMYSVLLKCLNKLWKFNLQTICSLFFLIKNINVSEAVENDWKWKVYRMLDFRDIGRYIILCFYFQIILNNVLRC